MTGTGEKKCIPSTRSGRSVAAASRAIGIEEVLGRQRHARGHQPVEIAEDVRLDLRVLVDGLDHELRTAHGLELRRRRDPREHRVGARSLELAGLRGTCEALLDAPARAFEHGRIGLVLDDVEAAAGRALGDPRPHEARADDCDRPGHDCLSLACDRRENSEVPDRLTALQTDSYPHLPIVG